MTKSRTSLKAAPELQAKRLLDVLQATLPSIPSSQCEALAGKVSLLRVIRRQRIASQDKLESRLYLLVSGQAQMAYLSPRGKKRIVAILSSGDFLGASALVSEVVHPPRFFTQEYYCDAMTDCLIAEIKPDDFIETLMGVKRDVFADTVGRTLGLWLHLVLWRSGLGALDTRARLLANLNNLAEKFGVQDSRGFIINLRITHDELAALVGTSRQKITTLLSALDREGLVVHEYRRLILSRKARS